MAILLALPLLIAIVYRVLLAARLPRRDPGFHLYGYLVALFWVRNALPLAALFYATALIADEVEGRTLTYLLTRPVRRNAILAGKFAAYLVTTLCLALPAAVLTFFVLATHRGRGVAAAVPDLFRDLGVLALTLLVYGALFTLMGVLLRRPLILGLLFLFVWELMANLPGYMPRFTITAWLRSLVGHRPAGGGLSRDLRPGAAGGPQPGGAQRADGRLPVAGGLDLFPPRVRTRSVGPYIGRWRSVMKRSRLVVIAAGSVVGLGLALALGALVLDPARAAVGPLPAEGLVLPADSRFVMGIDVPRFVQSPFYKQYRDPGRAARRPSGTSRRRPASTRSATSTRC